MLLFQHYLITITKSTCFCAALVRDEYDHIHSDIGMDDLEVSRFFFLFFFFFFTAILSCVPTECDSDLYYVVGGARHLEPYYFFVSFHTNSIIT